MPFSCWKIVRCCRKIMLGAQFLFTIWIKSMDIFGFFFLDRNHIRCINPINQICSWLSLPMEWQKFNKLLSNAIDWCFTIENDVRYQTILKCNWWHFQVLPISECIHYFSLPQIACQQFFFKFKHTDWVESVFSVGMPFSCLKTSSVKLCPMFNLSSLAAFGFGLALTFRVSSLRLEPNSIHFNWN